MERLTRVADGASFHRGLALGVLVGAAIAGSTLWTRLRDARRGAPDRGPQDKPANAKPRAQDLNGGLDA